MNRQFQKINVESVLFFDAEVVRSNKVLEIDSKEYELFQRKTRNRDTDEFLTDEQLTEEYDKKAALKRTYNRIVTIGVGYVKEGQAYIKELTGTEEEIIRKFVMIINKFEYCCSANGNAFDLPIIIGNGMKYFNIANEINDNFNPIGKKPWDLKKCIDLLDVFKGTHYYMNSLEELCYHFDIPTPKDDISGADVSRVYYEEGVDRIAIYVKKDVLANINLFQKMQGKDIFITFVDRGDIEPKKLPVLERLRNLGEITDDVAEEIKELLGKKKLLKKDIKHIEKILKAALFREDFIGGDQDNKDVRKQKEEGIKDFIESLKI